MNVIVTAPNGIVNAQTIFEFSQLEEVVTAVYAGGQIQKGFLVGILKNEQLRFTYCQLQLNGQLDNGTSDCMLAMENGKLRLIEHFNWGTRNGESGVNIFQQI